MSLRGASSQRGPGPWPGTRNHLRGRPVGRAVTVRDKVGRTRYVAFRLRGGSVRRDELGAALPPWARLTRFDGTHGLVRCLHTQRDELVAHLTGLRRVGARDVEVETLATSGTLRRAAEALPRNAPARARGRSVRKGSGAAAPPRDARKPPKDL